MPPRQPALTHFLCLPLVNSSSRPQLGTALSIFTKDATAEDSDNQIPPLAIRPLGTLHLTLGVMSLPTPERVDGALKVLKSLDLEDLLSNSDQGSHTIVGSSSVQGQAEVQTEKELDRRPDTTLVVTLKGLQPMQSPKKTTSLYASLVDGNGIMQRFCQRLRDAFVAGEFILPDRKPLLLHATVVNTIYVPRAQRKGEGHGKKSSRLTVDATDLIKKYENFEWMSDIELEKVCICQMGAKQGEDGTEEYKVEGAVEFPRPIGKDRACYIDR